MVRPSAANAASFVPPADVRCACTVMHMRRLARDHLGGDDALLLGFVCEHETRYAVTDGVDVREIRAHTVVDQDLAALADVETQRRGVDAGRRGAPPDGDEYVVAVD